VAPGGAAERRVANVAREIPQALTVEVATCGQDVGPCEELAALVVARVNACNADCLGLAADGLTALRVAGVAWRVEPDRQAPRPIWVAAVEVELLWRRIDA
jgi:hypothetical protein